jgi:hypothetical protein
VTAAYVSETKVRQPAPRRVYEFTSKNVQEQRPQISEQLIANPHALDHEVVLKRLIQVNFRVERKSHHAFVVLTFLIAPLVVTRDQKEQRQQLACESGAAGAAVNWHLVFARSGNLLHMDSILPQNRPDPIAVFARDPAVFVRPVEDHRNVPCLVS